MFLIYADISRHKKLLYCMYISDLWYYRANSMYQHVSRKSISSQSLQILTYAVFFWNYDACNVLLPRYPMKIIYLQHHMRTIYSPEDAQCCILLIGGTSDEYLLRGEGDIDWWNLDPWKKLMVDQKRVRFSKFQNWLALLRHFLISEPSKQEIHGLGAPSLGLKPGFSLKCREIVRIGANRKIPIVPTQNLIRWFEIS